MLGDGYAARQPRCIARIGIRLMFCEVQCCGQERRLIDARRSSPRNITSCPPYRNVLTTSEMLNRNTSAPLCCKLLRRSSMRVHFCSSGNLILRTWTRVVEMQPTHVQMMLRIQRRDTIPGIVQRLLLRLVVRGREVVVVGATARTVHRRRIKDVLGIGVDVVWEGAGAGCEACV